MSEKGWRQAFVENGMIGARDNLSTKLRGYGFAPPPHLCMPPIYEELVTLLPKAAPVWYWDLFGDLLGEPPVLE